MRAPSLSFPKVGSLSFAPYPFLYVPLLPDPLSFSLSLSLRSTLFLPVLNLCPCPLLFVFLYPPVSVSHSLSPTYPSVQICQCLLVHFHLEHCTYSHINKHSFIGSSPNPECYTPAPPHSRLDWQPPHKTFTRRFHTLTYDNKPITTGP